MAQHRSFVYQPRTYEDAKARLAQGGGNYDSYIKRDYKVYKVKDGKNLIRIMPATWKPAKHYGYSIWVNYSVGPDKQSYLSLAKMLKKPDPLAEARAEADREGNEEVAKELAPRERVLMWIIDRENEDEGPQVFACPKTLDNDILALTTDEDTQELVAIDNQKNGQDIRFYREGKGLNTKYPAAKIRVLTPSPLHEDSKQQDKWLDYIVENPIPDCLQFYDYDHISTVFNGHAKPEPKDDEPEDRPSKARKAEPEDDPPFEPDEKPRRTRPRIEEPEDEPEEPRSRRAAAKPRDEAEDEDDKSLSIKERLKARRLAQTNDDDE